VQTKDELIEELTKTRMSRAFWRTLGIVLTWATSLVLIILWLSGTFVTNDTQPFITETTEDTEDVSVIIGDTYLSTLCVCPTIESVTTITVIETPTTVSPPTPTSTPKIHTPHPPTSTPKIHTPHPPTETITPEAPASPTLEVELRATPNSGSVPLNGVTLIATLSGSATGDVRYFFECGTGVTFEKRINRDSYTVVEICAYPSPGTYTPSVTVTRQGITVVDILSILVTE